MDEQFLLAATRYIELSPVEAKLVKRPEQYFPTLSSKKTSIYNKYA
jgi:hypothetical protein